MPDTRPADDEIDLFELFETLWQGKLTIALMSVFTLLVGLAIGLWLPSEWRGKTPISVSEPATFTRYVPLNYILTVNDFDYQINDEMVFALFVSEFNDYEELVAVIENTPYVTEKLDQLEDQKQLSVLVKLAKQFVLMPPKKNETQWLLSFEWHDDEEARQIFEMALGQILLNVRQAIVDDIASLSVAAKSRVKSKTELIESKLRAIKSAIYLERDKQLLFLREQSAIAKELGLLNNTLDARGLSQSNGVSLNISASELPYYLRGSKAIDKEIALLSLRSEADILAMNEEYLAAQKALIALKNDVSAQQIEEAVFAVKNDNPRNWLTYDLVLADVKSKKHLPLSLALSLLLGGMLGVCYVLVKNSMASRRVRSA